MGNKEDWEDVEKSVRKAEEKKLKSYKGIDITEMLKRKNIKSKNNINGKIIKFEICFKAISSYIHYYKCIYYSNNSWCLFRFHKKCS